MGLAWGGGARRAAYIIVWRPGHVMVFFAFTRSPLLTPVPRRSNADCDKIDAKPRRCSPPFACPGAGNKSAKSRCGGGWLGATAQEMTLLNQEYAAVPGELKRSCCSEGARVAAVH